MVHLVFVRFDSHIEKDISLQIQDSFDSVSVVWTSRYPGEILSDPNECFEFSGYQEGLGRLIGRLDAGLVGGSDMTEIRHAVVFANDTLLVGHAGLMADFMLHSLSSIAKQRIGGSVFTGLVTRPSPVFSQVIGPQGYVSSWVFMLEGTMSDLRRVRFYEPSLVMRNFPLVIEPTLPASYVAAVDRWLQPESFLRGWYKAIPGKKLSESTLQRKRFAIYLEHTLPRRLLSQGFQMLCISGRLNKWSRCVLILLRLIDRVHANRLKWQTRLVHRFW